MNERDLPHNVLARESGRTANIYLSALLGFDGAENIDDLRCQYEMAERNQSQYFTDIARTL